MSHRVKFNPKAKGCYWWALLYTENMLDDWESEICSVLQLPFAYCIHNKDSNFADGTARKEHVHIFIAFPNPTTGKHALEVFQRLNAPGKNAVPADEIEQVIYVDYAYNYLIHDTEDARKAGKHLYDKSERITGNNFDIGKYEKLDTIETHNLSEDLADCILELGFTNFKAFYQHIKLDPFFEDQRFNYIELARKNSGFYERLCRGNYLEIQADQQARKDAAYFDMMAKRSAHYDIKERDDGQRTK